MNIIKDFDPEGVPVRDLKCGDLFMYDGSYYMRCNDSHFLMIWTEKNKNDCPAVDMATGVIVWIDLDIKVPPIYARIRINGRAD